ncbi:MAG: hypothetical protein GY705_03060, partial [Bacteroidetes bacterium]|nr:hypothetical protein [Bacteroidota bacterium]
LRFMGLWKLINIAYEVMIMKPMFIPLKSQFYYQYKKKKKDTELRLYGNGFNERTCTVGRKVVLSKGYGKHERLTGYIKNFKVKHATLLNKSSRLAIKKCYGNLNVNIACIYIVGIRQDTINGVKQLSLF